MFVSFPQNKKKRTDVYLQIQDNSEEMDKNCFELCGWHCATTEQTYGNTDLQAHCVVTQDMDGLLFRQNQLLEPCVGPTKAFKYM